jgi:Methyltransferase FkbM domain
MMRCFAFVSLLTSMIMGAISNHREHRHPGWGVVHIWNGEIPENKSEITQFHGQCDQDRFVVEEIFSQSNSGRFFIDLAANEAVYLSNSYSLERYFNWSGLCIETNPRHFIGLSKRKCITVGAVVSDKVNEEVTFNLEPKVAKTENVGPHVFGGIVSKDTDNHVASGHYEKFLTVSLAMILRRFSSPRIIDYLSLDVEGAEFRILSVFPFNEYSILSLSVERPKEDLHALLVQNGFWFVKTMSQWGETFYVHKSLPEFDAIMKKHRSNQPRKDKKWWDYEHKYVYQPQYQPGKGDAAATSRV